MAIQRVSLRNQVRDELVARMRAGDVRPGESINEVQLAAALGVSRTPLREALIALESSGQLESHEGRGFQYLPLSGSEFLELAPILATLESTALELTDSEDLPVLGEQLLAMAKAFTAESVPLQMLTHKDDEWHQLLVSRCPNQRLVDQIENTRQAFHRYESLLFMDGMMVARTVSEHVEIANRMLAQDLAGARAALMQNWTEGAARLAAILPDSPYAASPAN